jgi:hypothetical protein
MVPLALPGLTAPAVAGRGLSEGLGRTCVKVVSELEVAALEGD